MTTDQSGLAMTGSDMTGMAMTGTAPSGSEVTGDVPISVQRVHTAGQRLESTGGLPVAAHIDVYDDVHAVLQDALAELDEA